MANKTESILATPDGIERAVQILREGGLVAIPTETVYGLAARADSDEAVAKIYRAKGRPSFNPLIVHVANFEQAELFTDLSREVAGPTGRGMVSLKEAAANFWEDSTTLVVPMLPNAPLAKAVIAGLDTVALRQPSQSVARKVIAQVGPLAAPSANRSGFTSPTTAEHVLATLDGRIDAVLDAGPTTGGLESTILKLQSDGRWRELRPGPTDTSFWHESFFAEDAEKSRGATIEAPGQLEKHYSPGKPVHLDRQTPIAGSFMIGFGNVLGEISLSDSGNLHEAATRLYACLHLAAESDCAAISVAPIPRHGMGRAINDRLARAAKP